MLGLPCFRVTSTVLTLAFSPTFFAQIKKAMIEPMAATMTDGETMFLTIEHGDHCVPRIHLMRSNLADCASTVVMIADRAAR